MTNKPKAREFRDALDLLKEQSVDAQAWAKSFMGTVIDKGLEIDEALMIAWFANPIMCMYDREQKALTEAQAEIERLNKIIENGKPIWLYKNQILHQTNFTWGEVAQSTHKGLLIDVQALTATEKGDE